MPDQRYISKELAHFAGQGKPEEEQFQTLLAILRSGQLRARRVVEMYGPGGVELEQPPGMRTV